jgi:hypothetical protein
LTAKLNAVLMVKLDDINIAVQARFDQLEQLRLDDDVASQWRLELRYRCSSKASDCCGGEADYCYHSFKK